MSRFEEDGRVSSYRGRTKNDADYGLGEATIDGDKLGLLDEAEITRRIVAAFESPGYRPPRLPAVATQLLALSHNPDVEFDEIEALLERDAMLAGEVLSLARSAFYGGRGRRVDSLREALVRIGLKKLREVVMQAAMTVRVFRSGAYGGCMERLRDHCRATAHLSRIVSQYTPIAEEQAFLGGLLHDVGIAGILIVLGDTARGKRPPELAPLWPAIHGAHPEAGARMVRLWELPPELALAVGAHHQVCLDGHDHPLAAVVCLAEALAAELGLDFAPPRSDRDDEAALSEAALIDFGRIDRTDPATLDRARRALNVTESTEALILTAAREWAQAAAAS